MRQQAMEVVVNKRLGFVAIVVAGLALAGVAQAGCIATVSLGSMPGEGQAAGVPWTVTIRVLQHGRTPMPDTTPEIRIRDRAGKLLVFKGKRMARVGSYRARVVFPRAGRYSISVYDGFPYKECARSHPFRSVTVVAL